MDKDELERLLASVELTEEEEKNISVEEELADVLGKRNVGPDPETMEEEILPGEIEESMDEVQSESVYETESAESENAEPEYAEPEYGEDSAFEEPELTEAETVEFETASSDEDYSEPAKEETGSDYQYQERKRFLSFSKKLVGLCLLPMILICIVITIFSTGALRTGIENEVEKSLRIVAVTLDETYTNLYEGDYKKGMTGKVTKGDTTISGDTKLIDGIKNQTGFEASLFFGNMRLITTISKEAGGVAIGTSLDLSLIHI